MMRRFSKTKVRKKRRGNMGKFTFAFVLTGAAAAFAGLTGSVGQAVAQNTYTCMGFVTWKTSAGQTGINPYPEVTVSGNLIRIAASACHGATNTSFQGDPGWTPQAVCKSYPGHPDDYGRTFNGITRTMEVWAIDRFKEIAETPQLYNRVYAYTVTCRDGQPLLKTLKKYPGLKPRVQAF
jgi:hypothetical protein